jgi:hypothetical protein
MVYTPKKWKLPLKGRIMPPSCPQLNGTVVQKVEVTPNKIETVPKRVSPPKKWKMTTKNLKKYPKMISYPPKLN